MAIYLSYQAQIASLKAKKTPVTILAEYLDFINIFSKKFITVLPKHIKINTHTIDLEKSN